MLPACSIKKGSVGIFLCLWLCAAQAFSNAAPASVPNLDFVDGAAFVEKLLSETESWSDYTCTSELHNSKGEKTTVSSSRFFYKKGPQVRIEVIGGGFRDGSILVRSQGKVVARGGPWMGGMQMNLDPDSRLLILPSGANVTKADFPELFARMKNQLEHGYTCLMSRQAVMEDSKKTLILEVYDPDKVLRARVHLDADEHIPVRWESFVSDEVHTSTIFKNVRINTGLRDELFKL